MRSSTLPVILLVSIVSLATPTFSSTDTDDQYSAERALLNKYDDFSVTGLDRLLQDTDSSGNNHCHEKNLTANSSCLVGKVF